MVSVATFLMRAPRDLALAFLRQCNFELPSSFEWSGKFRDVVTRLKLCIDAADQSKQSRVMHDYERIASMADEAGQAALLSVLDDPSVVNSLENSISRSCWTYINQPLAFRRAEEARYTDEHRRGRRWTGVVTRAKQEVQTDPAAIEEFKKAVLKELRSDNVHVDVFERRRTSFDQSTFTLYQVSVFRDGLAQDFAEFIEGKLDWRSRRPVYEAALTYEPETGTVEVVAQTRESRENLLQIFVRDLLGVSSQEPLPFREYNLEKLLRPCKFPTDPKDGIESVRVTMLRLQPFDKPGERVTLECTSEEPDAIWSMASRHFGKTNSLLLGFAVTQAKLVIRFQPEADARRGKRLPLTVTAPHGCDLKDRSQREILVGEKYLRRWGLLRDE